MSETTTIEKAPWPAEIEVLVCPEPGCGSNRLETIMVQVESDGREATIIGKSGATVRDKPSNTAEMQVQVYYLCERQHGSTMLLNCNDGRSGFSTLIPTDRDGQDLSFTFRRPRP